MFDEIRQFLEEKGLPAMRFKQIEDAVFKGLILNFGDMQYLPKDLREELCEKFVLNPFEIVEVEDSSESSKFVFKTQDGNYIESVLMRHLKDRRTVCVSSQIFCAMGCKFCATGANKFKRNLTEEEIVFQVLNIGKYLKDKSEVPVKNVVFMGMGEPFMNYNNVLGAIRVFNDDKKMGIGARHITVSTCGLADKIEKFADEGLQVRLAISLHAPFDDLRSSIMPINQKFPIKAVLDACDYFVSKTNKKVSYEYVIIRDVNDAPKFASGLAKLLKGKLAHVNLIEYNPHKFSKYKKPSKPALLRFRDILKREGIECSIRRSMGDDISGACGQLAGK